MKFQFCIFITFLFPFFVFLFRTHKKLIFLAITLINSCPSIQYCCFFVFKCKLYKQFFIKYFILHEILCDFRTRCWWWVLIRKNTGFWLQKRKQKSCKDQKDYDTNRRNALSIRSFKVSDFQVFPNNVWWFIADANISLFSKQYELLVIRIFSAWW